MAERHYVYHVASNHSIKVFFHQHDAVLALCMLAEYHNLDLDKEKIINQLGKTGFYESWPLSIQQVSEP